EEALEMLQDHLNKMLEVEQQLDRSQLTQLRRPVESRLKQFGLLKAQKDLANGVLASRQAQFDNIAKSRNAEEMKRKHVSQLMKDFDSKFKEGKYQEAEALAMRAHDLDPDNGVAAAAIYMARRQRNVNDYRNIKEERERGTLDGLNDADRMGP